MHFKTQTGHWRYAAARFPDAVHFRLDTTYLRDNDYEWIYSWEAIALQKVYDAQDAGARAIILIHGNPALPPNTISLRTIIREMMRDDNFAPHLRVDECIECDESLIVVFRPLPSHRRKTAC